MELLKKNLGGLVFTALIFMSCHQNASNKFLGNYSIDENRTETTFAIKQNSDSTYVAHLLHMRLKDYVFKYNSKTQTLISSSNDSMPLNDKGELSFTNENGPRIFYKIK